VRERNARQQEQQFFFYRDTRQTLRDTERCSGGRRPNPPNRLQIPANEDRRRSIPVGPDQFWAKRAGRASPSGDSLAGDGSGPAAVPTDSRRGRRSPSSCWPRLRRTWGCRSPWSDGATGTRPEVGPGAETGGGTERPQLGPGAETGGGDRGRDRATSTPGNRSGEEATTGGREAGRRWSTQQRAAAAAGDDQRKFWIKHELRRAVDALDLGSDTMLGKGNLYYLGAKGHNI
jgi:hypothetical protein